MRHEQKQGPDHEEEYPERKHRQTFRILCQLAALRRTWHAASHSILPRYSEHPTGDSPDQTIIYRKIEPRRHLIFFWIGSVPERPE
jgi:hypothetical protein